MCRALKINNLKYVFAQGNRCAPLNIFHLPPDCFRDRSQCWNIRLQPRQRALSVQPTASLFGHPAIPRFIDASQIPTFKKKKKDEVLRLPCIKRVVGAVFPSSICSLRVSYFDSSWKISNSFQAKRLWLAEGSGDLVGLFFQQRFKIKVHMLVF